MHAYIIVEDNDNDIDNDIERVCDRVLKGIYIKKEKTSIYTYIHLNLSF